MSGPKKYLDYEGLQHYHGKLKGIIKDYTIDNTLNTPGSLTITGTPLDGTTAATTDSVVIPTMVQADVTYTLLTTQPESFDPTAYYKLVDGTYVAGTSGNAWATDTWYSKNTSTNDGSRGLVPAPPSGTTASYFLDATGNWSQVSTTDTTYTLGGAYGTGDDVNKWVTTLTGTNGYTGTSTVPTATTSVYGITKLSDATNSDVSTTAATSKAVKAAYDLANGKSTVSIANTITTGTNTKVADITTVTSGTTTTTAINVPNMTAPTTGASPVAGKAGLVPAPAVGDNTKFLTGAGTWAVPDDTKVNVTLDTTNNAYLLGTTTTPTSTTTATQSVGSTSVYFNDDTLYATNYSGKVNNYTISDNVPSGAVFTDRYVNTAAFADDSTSSANSPVKMTLTRTGSDSGTVVANIPKVSDSTAGVVPKGTTVSTQDQTTKFLREDGTWAAPSYTTDTNTTYTLTQDTNNSYKLILTPSTGSANEVTIPVDSSISSTNPGNNAVSESAIVSFVNSSVSTNTAYFKGTFDSLEELQAVSPVTNNDYGFVVVLLTMTVLATEPSDWSTNYKDYYTRSGTDPNYTYSHVTGSSAPTFATNTYYYASDSTYNRYKFTPSLLASEPADWSSKYTEYYTYNSTNNNYVHVTGGSAPTFATDTYYDRGWVFEYALNNSSFTASEWATIQSGLTADMTGTVTSITAGTGLTTADGSAITTTGTIKAKLQSYTALAASAQSIDPTTVTSNARIYPVLTDATNGNLAVYVPWEGSSSASTLTTARSINGVKFNGSSDIYNYATSSTAAATASKDALLSTAGNEFVFGTGSTINLKFTNTNTAPSPTVTIKDSTGSHTYGSATALKESDGSTDATLVAGTQYTFVYDGSVFCKVGGTDYVTTTEIDALFT